MIHISRGNSKLGPDIPNISLRPVKDCKNHKLCSKQCYALKAYRMYPSTRKAWNENSQMARSDNRGYFDKLREFIDKTSPNRFRYHVAGDIITQEYLNEMITVAREFPKTRFLCFTKRFSLVYNNIPDNLSIFFSIWPSLALPKRIKNIPFAWMQNGREDRIPNTAFKCLGSCSSCSLCWGGINDVVFDAH